MGEAHSQQLSYPIGTPTSIAVRRNSIEAAQFGGNRIVIDFNNISGRRKLNVGVHGCNVVQDEQDAIVVRRVNIVESIESYLHVARYRLMRVG